MKANQTRTWITQGLSKFALAAVAIGTFSMAAQAQDWPKQSIKFVVPFTAGSGTDIVARAVAERLTTALGHPVIIENKPGAGGTIAANQVAKAPADVLVEIRERLVKTTSDIERITAALAALK